MKINNKIILPIAMAGVLFAGCEEEIMEWGTPDGHTPLSSVAELPLSVKEAIANYKGIKEYAAQYTPEMVVGVGMGATQYLDNMEFTDSITYRKLVDSNFQMYTLGNAMKHDAIVTNSGSLNFATVDQMFAAAPADMKLYGHNFLWHTQQNQNYLKSLIAPKLVVQTDSDIESIIAGDATDFNGGTSGGWGSWGSNKESAAVTEGVGTDGTPCMVLVNGGDGNAWDAQFAYTFDVPLDSSKQYTIRFDAKSTSSAGELQFQYQNSTTYGSQGGYNSFSIGTDWTTYEYTFKPSYADADRIILNFGKVGATYYIDNIEMGIQKQEKFVNIVTNSDFNDDKNGYTGLWGKYTYEIVENGGHDSKAIHFTMTSETSTNYDSQLFWALGESLKEGKTYCYSFYAKSNSVLAVQFIGQNEAYSGIYKETFTVPSEWLLCEGEFTYEGTPADIIRVGIQFGGVQESQLWVDDFKFGEKNAEGNKSLKATTFSYQIKTPTEKREALLGAMESWIKGMADHLAEKNVVPYGYDVINEAIADGSNAPRGLNGVFGGSWDNDGVTTYDAEPTETETDGLSLNWGGGHFYWGYFIGDDYAVKAYQYARKYLPAETKLFYNDYNLETSPNKRKAVINFVKAIDDVNGSPIVDGIGTQCHLRLDVAADEPFSEQIEAFMAQVEESLTELAATGKLVRITELDISLGTANPAANQLEAQYEAYKRVFEAYKRIVPTAQQSGITIWTLTDHPDEHVYWLPDESPNLFDKDGKRKWSFKGVCDGLAGEDLGLQFGGDDYKAWYNEKNTGDF
jgi:GH35 family endo-1,4-beta-xylanase